MISLLISLLILGLILYLAYWVIGMLPIPQPFKTVITVVLGVIALIYLLQLLLGGGLGIPALR